MTASKSIPHPLGPDFSPEAAGINRRTPPLRLVFTLALWAACCNPHTCVAMPRKQNGVFVIGEMFRGGNIRRLMYYVWAGPHEM